MFSLFKNRIGRYKLLEEVGSGGISTVYKAADSEGNIVALKVLSGSLSYNRNIVERFTQEMKILKRLSHPNIVKVIATGRFLRKYYIVMEFASGISLKNRIIEEGTIDKEDVIDIIIQIADALEYIHRYSIIHRDVKPQNVLISGDKVKLTDFSIALLNPALSRKAKEFGSGTPTYMSPEQIKGQILDKTTDIYSLGVTAYEMLTGLIPFRGTDTNQIKIKHLNFKPTSMRKINPSLSEEVDRIVLKMLEKKPGDRYRDTSELIKDIRILKANE